MEYSAYTKQLQKQTNYTTTQNGAICQKSTLSDCLDFFYSTLKDQDEYYSTFLSALTEDREKTLKILFWHRDVRENGMGRRSNFRYTISKLNEWSNSLDFSCNAIFHYGRADDLLSLLDTKAGKDVLAWIKLQLQTKNSLVAKWMPRESSKKKNYKFYARRIASYMGWTSKQYRKNISELTNVVEQQMVAKKWDQIDFSQVPSQASLRYKNCFLKNSKKYLEWQRSLLKKDSSTKVNVGTLLPHQIVNEYGSYNPSIEDPSLEAMWSALPKQDTNCLVIADTSGSMHGIPMTVSLSLALYFAERNPFKGFITFSSEPQWQKINQNDTLKQKLNSIKSINCLNTNLQATFDLLFASYVETKQMPETILIISDMQFDEAINSSKTYSWNTIDKSTFFQKMKQKFKNWDIPFPKVVFWNVKESSKGVPVSFDESGTALISGYSPAVISTIMAVEDFNPVVIMNNAIQNINPKL